jgi:hypothetical protein
MNVEAELRRLLDPLALTDRRDVKGRGIARSVMDPLYGKTHIRESLAAAALPGPDEDMLWLAGASALR